MNAEELLAAAYRERAAVVAALIRVGGYPAQIIQAPDTEGWWIVYAETPAGQVSWHLSPDDLDLFSDVPLGFGTAKSPWDGHDTDEKYRRVAALRSNQLQVVERDRLARLEAEPTSGIQTISAQALFDKAKASPTHEVTITAQELRLLLPSIENEAKGQVLRPLRLALDSTTGDPE